MELERLGMEPTGRSPGRVFFAADAAGLFRANLCLRTAERVLVEAARYRAEDFDALFEGARAPAWEDFFGLEDRLVIERVRANRSQLDAQTSIQSVVHKAVYEKLGQAYGLERLPETGRERSVRVYLEDDECVIGIDVSGEALHKRGYRKSAGLAPLKETVAAGVLLLAGWSRRLPLLDPFCGSGTLLIEAALFGIDSAPGLGRDFELETMPLADPEAFEAERAAAKARIKTDAELFLVGSDVDEAVLAGARANAERAGVANLIDFRVGKAEDAEPLAEKGLLITNPPYGERLGTEEEAEDLYRRLGALAPRFKGWGLGFVTNRSDFGDFFGRRAVTERRVMNGAEEQWFHWYPEGFEDRPARGRREEAEPRDQAGRPPRRGKPAPVHAKEKREDSASGPRPRKWEGPDKPGWKPRPAGAGRYRDFEPRDGAERRIAGGFKRHEGGTGPRRESPRRDDERRDQARPEAGRRERYAGSRDEGRSGPPRQGAPKARWEGPDKPGWKPRPREDARDERRPFAPRRDEPRRDEERRPAYPRRDEARGGDERRPAYPRRDEARGGDERRPSYPRRDGERKPSYTRRDESARPSYPRRDDPRRDDPRRDDDRRPPFARREDTRRDEPRREAYPREGSGEQGKKPKVFRIEPPKRPAPKPVEGSESKPRRGRPPKKDEPASKKSSFFGGSRGPGRIDRNRGEDS